MTLIPRADNPIAREIPGHPSACRGVSGPVYTPDQCRTCWRATYQPAPVRGSTRAVEILPCRYRGEALGNVIPEKAGCGCAGRPAVFACEAEGEQYAVHAAPGWFGTTLPVGNIPASVIDWRQLPGTPKVRVRSCEGCPLREASTPDTATAEARRISRWSLAITTAPRKQSTLAATLASIQEAGWERHQLIVAAEPGTPVPTGWPTETAPERLGAWRNFLRALRLALERDPHADGILLFQDDVELSAGLRGLLESLEIPPDAGFVSPYCPTIYSPAKDVPGWFSVRPGSFRGIPWFGFVGALAVLFPRQNAEAFLQDEFVRTYDKNRWVDGVLGHWCKRAGKRPYCHWPSLIGHTGHTSTIHGGARATGHRQAETYSPEVPAVQFAPRFKRRELRLGVIGWATATGLGRLNWEACSHLPVRRWLVPKHPRFPTLGQHPDVDTVYCNSLANLPKLRSFLSGLDAVLVFELPYYRDLSTIARRLNVRTVAVAMHECMPPGCRGWPQEFDAVVAPNDACYRILSPAMRRGNLHRLNWPIDTDAIPFRLRTHADTFFCGLGTAGKQDRKGGQIIAAAAALAPEVPWVVRSQLRDRSMRLREQTGYDFPENVRHMGSVRNHAELYDVGDVAVQPSRVEGMGLQLLEAQAAGMPLITTNAGPMNEYGAAWLLPATPRNIVVRRPTVAHDVRPEAVADMVRILRGGRIDEESRAARANVVENWGWGTQRERVVEFFNRVVFGPRTESGTIAAAAG